MNCYESKHKEILLSRIEVTLSSLYTGLVLKHSAHLHLGGQPVQRLVH